MGAITVLLDGRQVTTEELAPLLYDELRRMADQIFQRERPGVTLQPTALVHEAWLKLADHRDGWNDRAHFLAAAANSMRRVLIDAAKARGRLKRGGDWERVTLDDSGTTSRGAQVELLDLDDALTRLAAFNETYVRLVELRYFAGLNLDETARVMGMGRSKLVKEWAKAKAWLTTHLEGLDA